MRAFNGWIIALAAVALVAGCGQKAGGGGGGGGAAVTAQTMDMGNPNAKATVDEWASVTCPHCAAFNEEVFPAFKAKYIDTGKVHYVFHEFLTPPVEAASAGFLVARCAGKDKYFPALDALFHSQNILYESQDQRNWVFQVGRSVGLNDNQITQCLQDDAALKALSDRVQKAADDDKITGTPTFKFNGKSLDGQVLGGTPYAGGEMTAAQLDAALAPLLK